jgi:hypothetical protein
MGLYENITKKDLIGDIAAVSVSSVKVKDLYKARGVKREGYRAVLLEHGLLDSFDDALNHSRVRTMAEARNVKRLQEGKERMKRIEKEQNEEIRELPGPSTLEQAANEKGPIVPARPVKKEQQDAKKDTTKKQAKPSMFGLSSSTMMWIGFAAVGAFLLYNNYKKKNATVKEVASVPSVATLTPAQGRERILQERWEGLL